MMGGTIPTGVKTSAAMDSVVLIIIKTIEMTDNAVIITEMTGSAVITTEMTDSAKAADPDRDLMAGATIKEDLATREPKAALCQKVRLRMPRSIEMRKSAASVRRKISATAKI